MRRARRSAPAVPFLFAGVVLILVGVALAYVG